MPQVRDHLIQWNRKEVVQCQYSGFSSNLAEAQKLVLTPRTIDVRGYIIALITSIAVIMAENCILDFPIGEEKCKIISDITKEFKQTHTTYACVASKNNEEATKPYYEISTTRETLESRKKKKV